MTHRYHPDPTRPDDLPTTMPAPILYDDCEDCTHKADTLLGLDSHNAARAVENVYLWRAGHLPATTDTEFRLIRSLSNAMILLDAAGALRPDRSL